MTDKVSDQIQDDKVSDDVELNENDKTDDSVKYDTFQRVLRQKKALEERVSLFEKQEAEVKMQGELKDQEDLKKQQKFEELSQSLEAQLKSEREDKETYKKSWMDSHKLQAVVDKLPGKIKRNEYLGFINLDKVEIDPTTGIVAESVEEAANDFLVNHSDLLLKAGKLPPGDAPESGKSMTREHWLTLDAKGKRANLHRVVNN